MTTPTSGIGIGALIRNDDATELVARRRTELIERGIRKEALTPTTGTEKLLALAADLRQYAPNVRDAFHLRISAELMERAAEAIEQLAPMDPDIEVSQGEN